MKQKTFYRKPGIKVTEHLVRGYTAKEWELRWYTWRVIVAGCGWSNNRPIYGLGEAKQQALAAHEMLTRHEKERKAGNVELRDLF